MSYKTYKTLNGRTFFSVLRTLLVFCVLQLTPLNFQLSTFNFQLSPLHAQDVTVTVTPVQQILPPQVMLYITEPANYFNISLSNTGKDNANVYLVMQVEQVNPSSGLSLSTPPKRQPKMPIVVPAGGTHILTPAEVRGLFNHIPINEIQAPADLFTNYANGSFGLLPEGQYELHMTAYTWDPMLADPVVASSPLGGAANFNGPAGHGSFSLAGRSGVSLPHPAYNSSREGKIIVKIWVDRQGNVTKTEAPMQGTTILDETMIEQARRAAMRSKFNADPDAAVVQTGTITYVFRKQ